MKIVNVRAHGGGYFHTGKDASLAEVEEKLQLHIFNSAPKNIGRELLRRGLASRFEEWRFWGFPTREYQFHGIPLRMFHSADGRELSEVERFIAAEGEPEIIWAEGIHFPPSIGRLYELCPNSLKLVYAKYCEPWLIEGLEHYDVCLVDEYWQIDEMARRHPGVRCRVWDKLIDYEEGFFPTGSRKKYDICYVARLHPRKYHKLLFLALEKLRQRRLSVVLAGSDENDCQKYLEPMAREAGVDAVFTGHVSIKDINRLINESRMGVLCDKYDAAPRAMLEYMAADVPVLATSEMRAGKRYIGRKAGITRSPARFHEGIVEVLENLDRFQPREHLLESFSRERVVDRLWKIVTDASSQETTGPSTVGRSVDCSCP